jgi:DNA-directed RNA polymerase specialized sigma24 family protein
MEKSNGDGHREDRGDAEGQQSSPDSSEPAITSLDVRAIIFARMSVSHLMRGRSLPHPHDENTVARDAYIEARETCEPDLFQKAFGLRSINPGRAEEARVQFRRVVRRVYKRATFTHKTNARAERDQATDDGQGQVADGPAQGRRRKIVPRDTNLSKEAAEQLSQANPRANLDRALDVNEAMGRLPTEEAQIVRDKYVHGKSVREIAEQRGMTDKKVRGIIDRSKEVLAAILRKDYSRA